MILCRLVLGILLIVGYSELSQAQPAVWKQLTDVEIQDRYEVSYPVFGEQAQQLDGQQIEVAGYMIPFEVYLKPKYFILSSLPIAACFFCGGAGPETVMEVFSQENIELSDGVIRLRGRLELNATDPDRMMYILRDAELVEDL